MDPLNTYRMSILGNLDAMRQESERLQRIDDRDLKRLWKTRQPRLTLATGRRRSRRDPVKPRRPPFDWRPRQNDELG
jgi:hypothetical protein